MNNKFGVEKEFTKDGFRCVVIAAYSLGHRCGYVEITKDSPLFNVGFDELNSNVKVHGGLTYDNISDEFPLESNSPSRWIGFDCNHLYDAKDMNLIYKSEDPVLINIYKDRTIHPNQKVRTAEFVESQLIKLVDQLKGGVELC